MVGELRCVLRDDARETEARAAVRYDARVCLDLLVTWLRFDLDFLDDMERLLEEFLADRPLLRLDDSRRSGERCMLAAVAVLRGAGTGLFSRDGRCCALGWLFGLDLCSAAGAAFS